MSRQVHDFERVLRSVVFSECIVMDYQYETEPATAFTSNGGNTKDSIVAETEKDQEIPSVPQQESSVRIKKTLSVLHRPKVTKPSIRRRGGKTSQIELRMKNTSRTPSPNPKIKLFRTTAEVHHPADVAVEQETDSMMKASSDTERNMIEQSTGELSLLNYMQVLYLLIPMSARPAIFESCLLAVLNLCLQQGKILLVAAMRDIIQEWHAWKKSRNYQIWTQQQYSLSTFANEFQNTKLCTKLYKLPMGLTSVDCQEIQKLMQPILSTYSTHNTESFNQEQSLFPNTVTTTM